MSQEKYHEGTIAEVEQGDLSKVIKELLPDLRHEENIFAQKIVEGFMQVTNVICNDLKSYGVRPFIDKSEGVDFIYPKVILANQEQCKKFFGKDYNNKATADVAHGTIILNVEALINELLETRKEAFEEISDEFEATVDFNIKLNLMLFDLVTEEIVHINSARISRSSNNPDTFEFGIGFYLSYEDINYEEKDEIVKNLRRKNTSLHYAVGENGLLPDKEKIEDDSYDATHQGDIGINLVELFTMFVVSSITALRLPSSGNNLLFNVLIVK